MEVVRTIYGRDISEVDEGILCDSIRKRCICIYITKKDGNNIRDICGKVLTTVQCVVEFVKLE